MGGDLPRLPGPRPNPWGGREPIGGNLPCWSRPEAPLQLSHLYNSVCPAENASPFARRARVGFIPLRASSLARKSYSGRAGPPGNRPPRRAPTSTRTGGEEHVLTPAAPIRTAACPRRPADHHAPRPVPPLAGHVRRLGGLQPHRQPFLSREQQTAADAEAARNEAVSFAAYRVLKRGSPAPPGRRLRARVRRADGRPGVQQGEHHDGRQHARRGGQPRRPTGAEPRPRGRLQRGQQLRRHHRLPDGEPAPGRVGPGAAGRSQPLGVARIGTVTQGFLTPHWGEVTPFALTRNDPGTPYFNAPPPPQLGGVGDARRRCWPTSRAPRSRTPSWATPWTTSLRPGGERRPPGGPGARPAVRGRRQRRPPGRGRQRRLRRRRREGQRHRRPRRQRADRRRGRGHPVGRRGRQSADRRLHDVRRQRRRAAGDAGGVGQRGAAGHAP